jgi:sulfide:quinone oxidoreductase
VLKTTTEKIVVLGAGVAGLAAVALLRTFADVTLVTRDDFNYYAGLPRYVMESLSEEYVRVSLDGIQRLGVKLIRGEVESIDVSERCVKVGVQKLGYDVLVVALGVEVADGPHLWTLQGARLFADEVSRFKGGTFVVAVHGLPYRCPPAPFDVASRLSRHFAWKGLNAKTIVLHPEKEPLAKLDSSLYLALNESMRRQGIELRGGFQPIEVDTYNRVLHSQQDDSVAYDLLHLVPKHSIPKALLNSEMRLVDGWPKLDKSFRAVDHDDVYIIGDLAAPSLGLPMAGFLAFYEASVVASSLSEGARVALRKAEAVCPIDFGGESLIPFCDFTPKLQGYGNPICRVTKVDADFVGLFREMLRSKFVSLLAGFV